MTCGGFSLRPILKLAAGKTAGDAAGFAYCFPNASHDKKAHDNDQDSYHELFMYRIHRLLFLTQVFFLQILLLRNVRFVCLSGSILSCKSLRYS